MDGLRAATSALQSTYPVAESRKPTVTSLTQGCAFDVRAVNEQPGPSGKVVPPEQRGTYLCINKRAWNGDGVAGVHRGM